MLALDSPQPERATIGGLVATGAYGPRRARYGAIRDLIIGVTLVRSDGAVLLRKHADRGLFAGLWDLPSATVSGDGVAPAIRSVLAACGIARRPRLTSCGEVRQVLTHRDLRVRLFKCRSAGDGASQGLRWAAPSELAELGLSSLARKCLRATGVAVPG